MGVDPEVRRLVAPLRDMYRAGQVEIPHEARRISGVAQVLGGLIETFTEQSLLTGNPAVLTSLIDVCTQVHAEMASVVPSLDNAALAVVATANDFVRVDEDARAASERLDDRLRDPANVPSSPTPTAVPAPPQTGPDPRPTPTRPHGGDQELT